MLSILKTDKKIEKIEFGSQESFDYTGKEENAFLIFYKVIALFSFRLKKALLISIGLRIWNPN